MQLVFVIIPTISTILWLLSQKIWVLLPNNKDTNHETLKGFFQSHIKLHQGKGLGYAKSTSKELSFFMDFALECGIGEYLLLEKVL